MFAQVEPLRPSPSSLGSDALTLGATQSGTLLCGQGSLSLPALQPRAQCQTL